MGTIGSNPSNPLYPVPGTTPPPATPPVQTEGSTQAPAEASGNEAGGEPTAPAQSPDVKETTAPVVPVTPDLKISKEMAEALSSNQVQGLIDGILADGTVDKLDDAKLKQLNILLNAAAKKNDNSVDATEDSLIDALDSRGMFGTNREVVKTNLQALKKHSGSANTLDFSGGIKLTTQDGVSGFFGGKQERALTLIDIDVPAAPSPAVAPNAPTSEQGADPVAGAPPVNPPADAIVEPTNPPTSATDEPADTPEPPLDPQRVADNAISRDARSAYHSETVAQNNQNQELLKQDIARLKDAFNEVPADVIRQDIKNVVQSSGTSGNDLAYIREQLRDWGVDIPTEGSAGDIQAHLENYEVTDANVSAYRNKLSGIADNALQSSPLTGKSLDDVKKYFYDKNYIFEKKGNVSAEDYQSYSQFKTHLNNYRDTESRVSNIARNDDIKTTNVASDNRLLGTYNENAAKQIGEAATEINRFLNQVETSSKKSSGVVPAELTQARSQLASLVEIGPDGQMVLENNLPKVKQPITQEHLDTLNQLWSSVEAVGIGAGLDQEAGEIAEAYFNDLRSKNQAGDGQKSNAVQQWNEIQKSPSGEILALKPQIAQYADLLKQLEDPKNAALKAALFSEQDPEAAVNKILAEHNTAVFNDSFGSFGGFWNIGPSSFSMYSQYSPLSSPDVGLCVGLPSPVGVTASPVPQTLPELYSLTSQNLTELYSPTSQTPPKFGPLAPAKDPKLALGSFTPQDVRALMDLIKNPPTIEGQTPEESAKAQSTQVLLRQQLQKHSSEIAPFISETPELAGLRQQLDAKNSFDTAFWNHGSELEQARQGVKTLLDKQDRVGADLAVAEAQLKNALEKVPDGQARTGLKENLLAIQNAQAELKASGQIYTENSAEAPHSGRTALDSVQSVMDSLRGKGFASENMLSLTDSLIKDAEVEQTQAQMDRTMQTLAAISSNPEQKQAILDKFPAEQQDKVSRLIDNHKLLDEIRKQVLSEPSMLDEDTLRAFNFAGYVTQLAETGSSAEIAAALNTTLPNSPLTVGDSLDHMDRLLNHVNQLKTDDQQLKATYATGLVSYFNEQGFKQGQSVEQAWEHFEKGSMTVNGETTTVKKAVQDSIVEKLKSKGGGASADFSELDIKEYLEKTLTGNESAAFSSNFSTFKSVSQELDSLQTQLTQASSPQQKTALKQKAMEAMGRLDSLTQSLEYAIGTSSGEDKTKLLELRAAVSGYRKDAFQQVQQDRFTSVVQSGRQLGETDKLIKEFYDNQSTSGYQYDDLIGRIQDRSLRATGVERQELDQLLNLASFESNQITRAKDVAANSSASDAFTELFSATTQGAREAQDNADENIRKHRGLLGGNYEEFKNLVLTGNLSSVGQARAIEILSPLRDSDPKAYIELLTSTYGVAGSLADVQGLRDLAHNANNPEERDRIARNYALSPISTALMQYISNEDGEDRNPPLSETSRAGARFLDEITNKNPPLTLEEISRRGLAFARDNHITDPAFTDLFSPQEPGTTLQSDTPGAIQGGIMARYNQIQTLGQDLGSDPEASEQAKSIADTGVEKLAEDAAVNYGVSAADVIENIETVDYASAARETAEIAVDFVGERAEKAETGEISWDTFRQEQNTMAREVAKVAERQDQLNKTLGELTGIKTPPLSDKYRLEAGLPVKSSGPSAGSAADQKASQLVEAANQLASRLSLTADNEGSEGLLSDLVNDFLNVIRDQDYKTRQLVMAQLANQMMTDSITNFYKDKTDKNNKYHQDALERMSDSFQRNIQRSIQDSLVSSAEGGDAQSVAAVSGQVGAANTAEAMGVAQLRASAEQLLSQAQQMEPPLLSDLQKERILDSLFDRNPDNDALGIMALAGLQSIN